MNTLLASNYNELNKKTIVSLLVLALVAVACAAETTEEAVEEVVVEKTTLETVTDRGFLKCGVSGSAVAFSETQADGSVTGIDLTTGSTGSSFITFTADVGIEFPIFFQVFP